MRKLIRVDGTEQDLPKPQTLEQIYRLIGCRTIDTVQLRNGEP